MSLEHYAMEAADPVAALEIEKVKHHEEVWVVGNVYLDPDRYNNMVTCAVVCQSLSMAKAVAYEKARNLLIDENSNRRYKGEPELKFEEAWTKVDHFDGIEHEYGYDPVDNNVSYAYIRVFRAESIGAS